MKVFNRIQKCKLFNDKETTQEFWLFDKRLKRQSLNVDDIFEPSTYYPRPSTLDKNLHSFVMNGRGGGVNRPILAHQYNAFIKASLSAIGLNSARGGATFAFSHEAPTAFIKAQGDWKSDAYLVYLTLSTENKFKILHSITNRLSAST